MASDIKDTGERFLPQTMSSDYERFWYFRQLAGYEYAARELLCAGDEVLEVGSGEGYGADVLAAAGAKVTALDLSPEAAAHAAAKYKRDNLRYLSYDGSGLPFPDATFDKVVSLHCIEHIPEDAAFLAEARRVLKKGGKLLVSTPNKAYRVQPTAWYKYHVREYTAGEFETLLRGRFNSVELRYLCSPQKFFDMEMRLTRTGNLIQRLDIFGLYRRVPNGAKQAFFRLFSALNRGNKTVAAQTGISTADFSLTPADVRGLDLLAVCARD
jgi:ubiquinone/menaquinone biosynthesis C-methylase UbiE